MNRGLIIVVAFLLTLLTINLKSQTVCKGSNKMFSYDFNYCGQGDWVKVFEDDFEGDTLDVSKWKITETIVREGPVFENSKAWPTAKNLSINNGVLKITAKREVVLNQCYDIWIDNGMQHHCSDFEHTSGEIESRYKIHYGILEARIKVPKGKGLWPSFWLYGDGLLNGRQVNNEIDIFEFRHGNTNKHSITIHFDKQMCLQSYKTIDLSKDFHTYTLVWLPELIAFYVDGNLVRKDLPYYSLLGQEVGCDIKSGNLYVENSIYPIHPLAVILGVGIENREGFKPDGTTPFPASMEVDWVRFYERKLCNNLTIENLENNLVEKTFNTFSGNKVLVGNEVIVPESYQAALIGSESVILKGQVKLEKGSSVICKTEKEFCTTGYQGIQSLKNNKLPDYEVDMRSKPYFPFVIYPNPFTSEVNIGSLVKEPINLEIKIFNMLGVLVFQTTYKSFRIASLDLSSLNSGILVLVIKNLDTSEVFNTKIFKL